MQPRPPDVRRIETGGYREAIRAAVTESNGHSNGVVVPSRASACFETLALLAPQYEEL